MLYNIRTRVVILVVQHIHQYISPSLSIYMYTGVYIYVLPTILLLASANLQPVVAAALVGPDAGEACGCANAICLAAPQMTLADGKVKHLAAEDSIGDR